MLSFLVDQIGPPRSLRSLSRSGVRLCNVTEGCSWVGRMVNVKLTLIAWRRPRQDRRKKRRRGKLRDCYSLPSRRFFEPRVFAGFFPIICVSSHSESHEVIRIHTP